MSLKYTNFLSGRGGHMLSFKLIKMFRSNEGFSLIQLLVNVAVVAVGSLFISSILLTQNRSVRILESKLQIEEGRTALLSRFLQDPGQCGCLFKRANPRDFPVAGINKLELETPLTSIEARDLSGADCTTAPVTEPIFPDPTAPRIRVEAVELLDIQNLGSYHHGSLRIQLSQPSLGPQVGATEILIPVAISTTPGSSPSMVQFSSCSIRALGEVTTQGPTQLTNTLQRARSFEVAECHRTSQTRSIRSACPAGWSLISCSGGPGDTGEGNAGYWIEPNYQDNSCTFHVSNASCVWGSRVTWQKSIATCFEI